MGKRQPAAKARKAARPAPRKRSPVVVAAPARKRGRPFKVHVEGSRIFNSMEQAAAVMGIPKSTLKLAKIRGCPGFGANKIEEKLIARWMEDRVNSGGSNDTAGVSERDQGALVAALMGGESTGFRDEPDDNEQANEDDDKGIGQAYRRMKNMELRVSKRLDRMLKPGSGARQEEIDKLTSSYVKISNSLLNMEVKLDQAKKDSGAMVPMEEVKAGTCAFFVWLQVGMSNVLRPAIPELEGKNRSQMAEILDQQFRNSVFRALDYGVKAGKLPKYMAECAANMARQKLNIG